MTSGNLFSKCIPTHCATWTMLINNFLEIMILWNSVFLIMPVREKFAKSFGNKI